MAHLQCLGCLRHITTHLLFVTSQVVQSLGRGSAEESRRREAEGSGANSRTRTAIRQGLGVVQVTPYSLCKWCLFVVYTMLSHDVNGACSVFEVSGSVVVLFSVQKLQERKQGKAKK